MCDTLSPTPTPMFPVELGPLVTSRVRRERVELDDTADDAIFGAVKLISGPTSNDSGVFVVGGARMREFTHVWRTWSTR